MYPNRTSWQVTRSVWHALFVREALARTTADRMAWFWMVAEPLAMIAIMVSIRSFVAGGRYIGGIEFITWIVCGLFGFFLYRDNMIRSIGAIAANKALFTYRQVSPVDPVLIRCYLEGLIKTFVLLLFVFVGSLLGLGLIPENSMVAISAWCGLWMLGAGAGLLLSVVSSLVPEIGKIVRLSSLPLLIISNVMLPINYLPYHIQQILLFNPVVHGLEFFRLGFDSKYRFVSDDISVSYFVFCILLVNLVGLMLHVRFSSKLKSL